MRVNVWGRRVVLSAALALGLTGAGLFTSGPGRADDAPKAGGPPALNEVQKAAIKSAIENNPPRAVQAILKKTGNGARVSGFASRVLRDAIHRQEIPGLPPVPAGDNPAALAAGMAQALDQLTEQSVRAVMRRRLVQLTGYRLPPRLKNHVLQQNAHAANALRLVPGGLRAGGANDPDPGRPRLDWRDPGLVVQDTGIVTEVRDQNTPTPCGCCWAFATVGALESAYAKQNLRLTGISEQHVLNQAGNVLQATIPLSWDCNGGSFAFDMFSVSRDLLPNPGAPRRSALPYTGVQNQTPQDAGNSPYRAQTWGYVSQTGDDNAIPSDTDLKQALCRYGPLAAAITVPLGESGVDAADNWSFYGSASDPAQKTPFQDFPNNPAMAVNHAIVIVGWDDALGSWVVKNSWGADWGDAGFFYVKYGYNNVGTAACWVLPVANP